MQDKSRIWGFFAHASIIVGMMFIVFFVIDRFNPAMEFLTSGLSKWLIFLLAVCALFTGLYSAVFLFQKQKRRDEKRSHPQARPAYEKPDAPQERFAQPYYDPRGYAQQRQMKGSASSQAQQSAYTRTVYGQPHESPGRQDTRSGTDYDRRESYRR
jgi:hypothetical protein